MAEIPSLQRLVSPQVLADRRVRFQVAAPQAKSVLVKGLAGLPPTPLTRGPDGVWSVTVGPLEPEIYSYVFEIDGADTVDPHNRRLKAWLACESQVEIPGSPPLLHEHQGVPHGSIHRHWYDSQCTHSQRGVWVYTPPGYSPDGPAAWPLMVVLHGYGDDESAWLEVGQAHRIADNLLAAGRIRPVVMAFPYGHPVPIAGDDFESYIVANLPAMEADVTQDLVPMLARDYRLIDDRGGRAITGLSMGGGQSIMIGLRHRRIFGHVGGFSAAVPRQDLAVQLSAEVARPSGDADELWLACGVDDFLLERNDTFSEWLAEHRIAHHYHRTSGGHDWMVWRGYLADFLQHSFPA
ncbi:MAG: alpha/beta hydrolase-fold protein [Pirellulales bacterium]